MPSLNISGSTLGEDSSYTLLGPPVKIMPIGFSAFISSSGVEYGFISQYTLHSRTRLAIS